MGSAGFLRLSSHVTVRQILERDDFQQRLEANRPLALHEVMYPLVMAYDSARWKQTSNSAARIRSSIC